MNSYMDIAEKILDRARRPMTARQILVRAYQDGVVPPHLYGSTQHKTLQARLSEDILAKKDHSAFFRPKPGQFFLRRFIDDSSIPEEFRRPIVARRRTRDLLRGPALAVRRSALADANLNMPSSFVEKAFELEQARYLDPRHIGEEWLLVWSIAVVVRRDRVLTYRAGRYRDDRDSFALKRTISFSSLVPERAPSLFDRRDVAGIKETALESVVVDLDVPSTPSRVAHDSVVADFRSFLPGSDGATVDCLLAIVVVECPSWFEPTTRRLSLNDLRWMDLRPLPNDLEDLDPWSKSIWSSLVEHR